MKKVFAAMALASVLASPSGLAAQTTISSGGGSIITAWGRPNTQTYGQTFKAPALDQTLDAFSFWLGGGSNLTFKAYVFAWDNSATRATGSALYTSATRNAPAGSGFQRVDVATGGVSLTGGIDYVMFLSTSGLNGDQTIGWESTGIGGSNGYNGGAFVFINNGDNTSAWTQDQWSTNWQGTGGDLRFEAKFSTGTAVPEPSTYALMAFGLVGLGFASRRRRVS